MNRLHLLIGEGMHKPDGTVVYPVYLREHGELRGEKFLSPGELAVFRDDLLRLFDRADYIKKSLTVFKDDDYS